MMHNPFAKSKYCILLFSININLSSLTVNYPSVMPPSIFKAVPVTKDAASDSR